MKKKDFTFTLFTKLNKTFAHGFFQVNQVTHWMDNSQVYGSEEIVHKTVRLYKDGLMRTEPCENGLECLPFAVISNCFGKSPKCSLAGTN